jgi:hypothetical protein
MYASALALEVRRTLSPDAFYGTVSIGKQRVDRQTLSID